MAEVAAAPETRLEVTEVEEEQEEEEEGPQLSAETFSALAEFYQEQEEREARQAAAGEVGEVDLPEDWQLSQFWYSEPTAAALATAVAAAVGEVAGEARVACVSAPTLYRALAKLPNIQATCFEFDQRFAAFGADFRFYDYRAPLEVDRELREAFDLVFLDPPFLSEECLAKTAVTARLLAKERGTPTVLCTGEVMAELAARLLDLRMCAFLPQHENNLANQFRCFANFDLDARIPQSAAAEHS